VSSGAVRRAGDGTNHWSAGHTLDAARLYRLALEDAPAGTRQDPSAAPLDTCRASLIDDLRQGHYFTDMGG
jgi:hypothetical protein